MSASVASSAWKTLPEEARRPCALLFVDFDDFKRVNDSFGHVVGDRVLQVLGVRLGRVLREGDLVVRYGGDEFVVFVYPVMETSDLAAISSRIRDEIAKPMQVAGHTVSMTASVGAAIAFSPNGELEEVIARADREMYAEKRSHAESNRASADSR